MVLLCLLNPGKIAKFTKKTSADMSGHRTPWSNSSLPSDRIKPSPPPTRPSSAAKNKGKGKEPQQQPRSAAVRSLEVLIRKLKTQSGTERDPEDGCFCQARTHELSSYSPICVRCGLILCVLNQPYFACPHCQSPLLSEGAKTALIENLQVELAETIVKEEEVAERARDDAKRAEGAFPLLGMNAQTPPNPSASPAPAQKQPQRQPQQQTHKVLSLNSKTKKVTVASYVPIPVPLQSSNSGRSDDGRVNEPKPVRVPPPPRDVELGPARTWAELRGRRLTYQPDPAVEEARKKALRKEKRRAESTTAS